MDVAQDRQSIAAEDFARSGGGVSGGGVWSLLLTISLCLVETVYSHHRHQQMIFEPSGLGLVVPHQSR